MDWSDAYLDIVATAIAGLPAWMREDCEACGNLALAETLATFAGEPDEFYVVASAAVEQAVNVEKQRAYRQMFSRTLSLDTALNPSTEVTLYELLPAPVVVEPPVVEHSQAHRLALVQAVLERTVEVSRRAVEHRDWDKVLAADYGISVQSVRRRRSRWLQDIRIAERWGKSFESHARPLKRKG